ncbi:hypothetical protein PPL_00903 [Heterostelium album PN500]|uniref:Uncharacterized protein n=1 Tax=Heterostelium pallidum (strain ATCC 26659 / Pp 5 / PN500) TaxID=670386 RepID=D3AYY4_HETP5|nr:hypothetical protein PPL_00903 [Heterostelium album PN500]EFA85674.1 hypothetical protein PPL_00903 [Heterostelium album PN500]|eukprot:XP_020437781.1 hypothetical protein PPL_00903 [Heterostelium album PN500]
MLIGTIQKLSLSSPSSNVMINTQHSQGANTLQSDNQLEGWVGGYYYRHQGHYFSATVNYAPRWYN